MNTLAKILVGIATAIIIIVISVGGYLGGWWLNSDVTNRQQHIDRQNYGSQLSYQTSLEQGITEVSKIDTQLSDPSTPSSELSGLRGQRIAIITQSCTKAHLLTNIPDADASWVSTNC